MPQRLRVIERFQLLVESLRPRTVTSLLHKFPYICRCEETNMVKRRDQHCLGLCVYDMANRSEPGLRDKRRFNNGE